MRRSKSAQGAWVQGTSTRYNVQKAIRRKKQYDQKENKEIADQGEETKRMNDQLKAQREKELLDVNSKLRKHSDFCKQTHLIESTREKYRSRRIRWIKPGRFEGLWSVTR